MRTPFRPLSALALVALAVLTACGTSGSSTSGPVTLNVWSMGTEGDILAKSDLLTQFHAANPNITVSVTSIPWAVAHDKLITSVAGRQTPDVTQLGTTWMGEFAKLNALDQPPSTIDNSAFFTSAESTATANGKVYGAPWYVETRVLYYRMDLATKAGLSNPPQTWDDLNKMAQQLKASGSKFGIDLGTNDWQQYLPFLWSNGGDIMKNGKFTLDSPAAVTALKEYASFFSQGLTPGSQAQGFDVTQSFVSGDTPMFFSGPWMIGVIDKAAPQLKGKYGVVRMPKMTSSTSFVGGADLAVFKNSPNRDAAWKFVAFMTRKDSQVSWYKASADLPAVKASWQDAALTGDASVTVFGNQLNDAKTPPPIAQWEEVAKTIDDWMEKAALGTVTPEAATKGMQQAATALYKP
jgi:multiple sugar transport system substrate-binding protein